MQAWTQLLVGSVQLTPLITGPVNGISQLDLYQTKQHRLFGWFRALDAEVGNDAGVSFYTDRSGEMRPLYTYAG